MSEHDMKNSSYDLNWLADEQKNALAVVESQLDDFKRENYLLIREIYSRLARKESEAQLEALNFLLDKVREINLDLRTVSRRLDWSGGVITTMLSELWPDVLELTCACNKEFGEPGSSIDRAAKLYPTVTYYSSIRRAAPDGDEYLDKAATREQSCVRTKYLQYFSRKMKQLTDDDQEVMAQLETQINEFKREIAPLPRKLERLLANCDDVMRTHRLKYMSYLVKTMEIATLAIPAETKRENFEALNRYMLTDLWPNALELTDGLSGEIEQSGSIIDSVATLYATVQHYASLRRKQA